jgi:hypothetical protein
MTDLEALVVAAYVFADEYPVPARPGRPPLISDAELVALAVAQGAIGISSDRQFLGLVSRVLPGWFPHLPEQSQYNRRLRGLVELSESCSTHSPAAPHAPSPPTTAAKSPQASSGDARDLCPARAPLGVGRRPGRAHVARRARSPRARPPPREQ